MKKNNAFSYLIAVLGILIFSAGLCVLGESIIQKINEQNWFLIGTIALILINTGLSLMISSKDYKR